MLGIEPEKSKLLRARVGQKTSQSNKKWVLNGYKQLDKIFGMLSPQFGVD